MDSTLDIDKIQKRIDRTNDESDDSEERPSKRPRQDLFLSDSDDTIPRVKRKDPPAQDTDPLFDVDDDINEEMAFKPLPSALNEEELPSKAEARPRQDLFLSDSEDAISSVKQKDPSAQDIDALFDMDDDIDEDMAFKPLPPALNEEELRSQAEARYRKELPPLTPHQVLPTQLDMTEKSGLDRQRTSKDNQAKDEKKERRKLTKLDENRLLSRDGFPQLVKMTKDFRISGKGHEATDLNRLLQVYQYWTHQLYPKTQFRDTVERVEKLCHSRRMQVSLSVWRDEAHGRLNRNNTPEDDEGIEDGDDANNSRVVEHSNPNLSPPSSFQAFSTEISRTDANTESNSRETEAAGIQGIDFGGDDDVFWSSPDITTGDKSQKVATKDITATDSSMDQDQEMWDIVNELEKEGQIPSAVAPMTQPTIQVPPDSGDDWEDMYL